MELKSALAGLGTEVTYKTIPLDEVMVALPADHLHAAVQMLGERSAFPHLSAITGQEIEGQIELLYHFWDQNGLTLRIALPSANPTIHTITDIIPGAALYEREIAEMLGVTFDGHPMSGFFILPDGWEGSAPLRRETPMPPAVRPSTSAETKETPHRSSPTIVPIGPQHPLLKEPLSVMLNVEGERVLSSTLRIGYVHRGIERLAQERSYVQNVHLLERVCGICSHVHTTAYCQGVEALLGLQVPPRGLYLRTLLCELERVHSHLLWLGVLAENIGFTTIFMYAWHDREAVLDVMEELSGGRVTHSVNVIGGVRIDVDAGQARDINTRLEALERELRLFLEMIEHEHTLRARIRGIGHLSSAQVRSYGAVGPVARASGVDVDLRRDAPYAAYDRLRPRVIVSEQGDVWARTSVRTQEIAESLRLCRQLLGELPEGPTAVRAPRRVPAGEVISRAEAPRGELLYYIRSDGSGRPARIKIRTPTLPSLATLPTQLRNVNTADVSAILSGVDLCIACADR